jgi:hypothetical protein
MSMGDGEEGGSWFRPAATWIAAASIVLVAVNGALVLRNQAAQREVNERQQTINQGVQLSRVSQFLVETVARVAVAAKDDKLTALLERHGVHVKIGSPPEAAGAPGAQP